MSALSFLGAKPGVGLFIVRIALAVVFLVHGIQKLSNMEGTVAFFSMIGLSAFFAWLVAIFETLSGVAMLTGYWAKYAGIVIVVIMLFAIILVKSKSGIMSAEIDFVLLLSGLAIAFGGPGAWAVRERKGSSGCASCQAGSCAVHGTGMQGT
jgi:putative oxidoreductase